MKYALLTQKPTVGYYFGKNEEDCFSMHPSVTLESASLLVSSDDYLSSVGHFLLEYDPFCGCYL